jgi:hypothetical protein
MLTYYTLKKLREEREGKESQVQEQPMNEQNYEFAPQVEAQSQKQVEAEMNEQNPQEKFDEKPKKK